MHDIKLIRDDPAAFDAAMRARGLGPQASAILAADDVRKAHATRLQNLQTRRNAASKEIGAAIKSGDTKAADALKAEVAEIKLAMEGGEEAGRALDADLGTLLAGLPNLPHDDVPVGPGEEDNVEIRRWGAPRDYGFAPKQHFEVGEALGQLDFETAAKMSGARFAILRGQLARMERALAQFMLDTHTQAHGYTEVSPPYLVRDEAMFGTAQLPKFRDDQFGTLDGRWLIPTSEVPLTNLVRESVTDEADLPLRVTAYTPCFRLEAGSAGRDTRGLIRLHQFHKVEMVSVTTPDASSEELERMTGCAEAILQALQLPYRVMKLSTGDMGFAARRTYDLEVWLPGQGAYREISSCSACGDFQARRMDARLRPSEGKRLGYVHTLNGSGVAVGRALVAVMETYQKEDGRIGVPDVLRLYMGGIETIG